MAISQIGKIIKNRRMELGLSQEELADGICAVPTLSRIENGERMPTQNHLEMLLQRIGYSDIMFDSFTDETGLRVHELKFSIRQAYIESDIMRGRNLLAELEEVLKSPTHIDKQFLILQHVLLYEEQYPLEEQLARLEEALRLTHPQYGQNKIPYLLSYEEIILLNNIAVCQSLIGNRKVAIDVLYGVSDYYDCHLINIEESLRTQPLTLYNLSKMLGLENRYNECIEICEKGINLAKKTGRCQLLGHMLYNKAWALVKKGYANDLQEAKRLAQQAIEVASILEKHSLVEHLKQFLEEYHLN